MSSPLNVKVGSRNSGGVFMNQVGSAEREKPTVEVETQELLASGEDPQCQVTGGLVDCLSSFSMFC